jgi:hypothetical protein
MIPPNLSRSRRRFDSLISHAKPPHNTVKRIDQQTGDEDGRQGKRDKKPADYDGKIKATPPFGRFAVVGQWVKGMPRETAWCRLWHNHQ